jgi:phosphomevalonate kinase
MKILLLSGWSHSGKSTVADLLKEKQNAYIFAFADRLKEIVANELQIPLKNLHTQEGKKQTIKDGQTVREYLIQRAQEIRQDDTAFFAKYVVNQIQNLPKDAFVVISDWRLPIEYKTLKEELHMPIYELYTIRVQNATQTTSPVQDQETEHQLDSFPFRYRLKNSGTNIHQLQIAVSSLLFHIQSSSPK